MPHMNGDCIETVIDFLRATRKLIERPEAWTKDVDARDREGRRVPSIDGWAVCWCLTAALGAVAATMGGARADELRRHAHRLLCRALEGSEPSPDDGRQWRLEAWNDDPVREHADILALIDRAIDLGEQVAQ